MPESTRGPRLGVAMISSYVPRQCGIATFTHDLASVIAEIQGQSLSDGQLVRILALNEHGSDYEYGPEVQFEIRDSYLADYEEAAGFVNVSPASVVSVQHEFGIFGGEAGRHLMAFLSEVRKPVVTTLHTILERSYPDKRYLATLKEVCDLSTFVVVMAERARDMLAEGHGIDPEKIRVIPHGVPDVPFLDPGFYKDQFQLEGRKVILTFGLIGPSKGIETMIDALPAIVERHPDAAYIVLGATHPEIRRQNGEAYRAGLERTVREKNLSEHVFFYNRYVTLDQLLEFLLASDTYVTPYVNKQQITSGTLAYAAGCGKAVVSTPYWHAEELLANGRGVLVPFKDPAAMAGAFIDLLDDEVKRNQMRKRAYQHARSMVWKEVGREYIKLFREAIDRKAELRLSAPRRVIPEPPAPEIKLDHVRRLTDDTGILRTAVFATPNRHGGYATEDNALALVVAVDAWRMFEAESMIQLIHTYLSFLHFALDESGLCRGRLSYDRKWQDSGSEAACARAIWALGHTVGHAPSGATLGLAAQMFDRLLHRSEGFSDARAIACAIVGIHRYLIRFSGASELRRLRETLAGRLFDLFDRARSDEWPWCADAVGREAGHLPHALLLSGRWLERGEMVETGLVALDWLFDVQSQPETGWLSLIGDRDGYSRGGEPSHLDQRPVEAAALACACEEAYLITGDGKWSKRVTLCLNWFLGWNDRRETLYDYRTQGVSDGIEAAGLSPNQGAGAALAWLTTLMAVHRLEEAKSTSAPAQAPAAQAPAAPTAPAL